MRNHILIASLAAATLIPSLASAQITCEQRSANRAAGTAVGAVTGALIGSAVAGHGDKGTGAVVGGIGGAIVGNQLARGPRDCAHAYGYYDNDNRWHGNNVSQSAAYGYYDRNGVWVDGRPAGHYDRGVWIADAGGYGANASYENREHALDVDTRIDRMQRWIARNRETGRLDWREAREANRELNDIKNEERYRLRDGRLGRRDEYALQDRLDRLQTRIRYDRQD